MSWKWEDKARTCLKLRVSQIKQIIKLWGIAMKHAHFDIIKEKMTKVDMLVKASVVYLYEIRNSIFPENALVFFLKWSNV